MAEFLVALVAINLMLVAQCREWLCECQEEVVLCSRSGRRRLQESLPWARMSAQTLQLTESPASSAAGCSGKAQLLLLDLVPVWNWNSGVSSHRDRPDWGEGLAQGVYLWGGRVWSGESH